MATAVKNRVSANGVAAKAKLAAEKRETNVEIKQIQVSSIQLTLKGVTPLIVNRLGEAVRKYLTERDEKKAKAPRGVRNPHQEYLNSLYVMPGSTAGEKSAQYGLPASGFKKAAVSACRYMDDMTMTWVKGAFFIHDDGAGLVRLKYGELVMREDMVRLQQGRGAPEMRYRGEFRDWSVNLRIRFNAGIISKDQIVSLFQHAGFHIGWGELRPEKGYSNGSWEVG